MSEKAETKVEAKEPKAKKAPEAAAPKIADHATPAHSARAEKKKSRWTVATCSKAAKRYQTRAQWAANSPSSYKAASAKGWIEQCCKHMGAEPAQKSATRHKKSA